VNRKRAASFLVFIAMKKMYRNGAMKITVATAVAIRPVLR
jgi:hypothetical protein